MLTLVQAPEKAVPCLKEHLAQFANVDAKQVARLLKNLDSDEFDVREKATEGLEKLGAAIEPNLREALKGELSEEARTRLQQVLSRFESGSSVRGSRALEVLERIGSPEAREVLQSLAKGASQTSLTKEAQACLERLTKTSPAKP
jgi:HEAT repeat protein